MTQPLTHWMICCNYIDVNFRDATVQMARFVRAASACRFRSVRTAFATVSVNRSTSPTIETISHSTETAHIFPRVMLC